MSNVGKHRTSNIQPRTSNERSNCVGFDVGCSFHPQRASNALTLVGTRSTASPHFSTEEAFGFAFSFVAQRALPQPPDSGSHGTVGIVGTRWNASLPAVSVSCAYAKIVDVSQRQEHGGRKIRLHFSVPSFCLFLLPNVFLRLHRSIPIDKLIRV